ncbi:hypothetical protein V8G54_027621 [Vigna mungo]|uniref:Uncharacterized protein n=1 Tax=Vigna mungo TaxID=3915 RepID=A0AAQ3N2X7_VIGMU
MASKTTKRQLRSEAKALMALGEIGTVGNNKCLWLVRETGNENKPGFEKPDAVSKRQRLMEAGRVTTARKVALRFEPFPLFAIRFCLFSSAALLMLCGGEMKCWWRRGENVEVVTVCRIMVVLLEKMKIHGGDIGGGALQHDSGGGALAATCAWWWCEVVAAMKNDTVSNDVSMPNTSKSNQCLSKAAKCMLQIISHVSRELRHIIL